MGGWEAIGLDPKPAAAPIYGDATKYSVGDRHHLHSHLARLALSRRGHGPVLSNDRRLGGSTHHSPRARAQCGFNGGAPTTTTWHPHSFGSGHAIRERCLATILPLEPAGAQHEPQ